jgi:hypothetical protein
MPTNLTGVPSMSPAASQLGLGTMLGQQVKDETEEQRRKRLLEQQLGARTTASPAMAQLFGLGGLGR